MRSHRGFWRGLRISNLIVGKGDRINRGNIYFTRGSPLSSSSSFHQDALDRTKVAVFELVQGPRVDVVRGPFRLPHGASFQPEKRLS